METVNLAASQLAVAALFGLLLWAAYSDAVRFVIPNRLSLCAALIYPAYVLAATGPVNWLGGLATGAIFFCIGFLLYARNYIGGGDAKLLAAVALWAGPDLALSYLVVTTLAGALVSLLEAVDLRLARARTPDGRPIPLGAMMAIHVPYGIAIAIGGLFVAAQLLAGNWR